MISHKYHEGAWYTTSGDEDLKLDHVTWRMGSGHTIEIFDICVTSERRKGIGRSLVEAVKEYVRTKFNMRDYTLWALTRSSNKIAQEFYAALGFTVGAVLNKFYGPESNDENNAILYMLLVK